MKNSASFAVSSGINFAIWEDFKSTMMVLKEVSQISVSIHEFLTRFIQEFKDPVHGNEGEICQILTSSAVGYVYGLRVKKGKSAHRKRNDNDIQG